MSKEQFELGKMPQLTIEACHGNLVVKGWGETAVSIKGGEYQTSEDDLGLTITSQGQLNLSVPFASSLAVGTVSGDLVIKNVEGDISLQERSWGCRFY